MAKSSLVQYESFSEDDAKRTRESLNLGGNNAYVDMKQPGKYRVRFLPAQPKKSWIHESWQHFIDVPGTNGRSVLCPMRTAKKKCPVCAKAEEYSRSDKELDQRKAKGMWPRLQCLANVIVRGKEEEGPRILRFGKKVAEQILDLRDEDVGGNFLHPEKGMDLIIIRTGLGFETRYKVVAANKGQVLPLSSDVNEMNDWITNQYDLSHYAPKLLSAEDITKLMNGDELDEFSGDDPELRPRGSKMRSLADEIDDGVDGPEDQFDDEDE